MNRLKKIGLLPALAAALMLLAASCYTGRHHRTSRRYQRSSPSHHDNRNKQKGNRGKHRGWN